MNPDTNVDLAEVFCEVIETQAFTFADPLGLDEVPTSPDSPVRVAMNFFGPMEGSVEMSTTSAFCLQLTANMLGVEVDDSASATDATDALQELLNVTCGQILTALYGTKPVFDLSPPKARSIDAAAWEAARHAPGAVAFLIDDEPLMLTVAIEGLYA